MTCRMPTALRLKVYLVFIFNKLSEGTGKICTFVQTLFTEMKKTLFFVMLTLFVFACKKESIAPEGYLNMAVGIEKNGKYQVDLPEGLETQWEKALTEDGIKEQLADFEIIKGITRGDVQEDYYLLLARSKSGVVKTAAMLTLKTGKFYFEKQDGQESQVYIKILCSGECPSGCDPLVHIAGKNRFLVCSPCIDCVKTEKEMR